MKQRKLIFRLHALSRMSQRGFEPADIHFALDNGTIIEQYPDDFPYPSCLIMALIDGRPVHVVAALNDAVQETIIVTVYEPDVQIWDNGFTRRKL
jgi:hypothetical protein